MNLADHSEVFDHIPVPATLIDRRGIIVDINQAFLRYAQNLGRNIGKDDRIGYSVLDFADTEERKSRLEAFIDNLLDEGESVEMVWEIPDAAGKYYYMDVRASVLRSDDGGIKGALLLWVDITDEVLQNRRGRIFLQIRNEILEMHRSEDMGRVLTAVRDSLRALDIPFNDCGVNLIDQSTDPPSVLFHSMVEDGRWRRAETGVPGTEIIARIWNQGDIAYRRDLETEDINEESTHIDSDLGHHIRSVVDVPFSHGTLAVNSTRPNAFSAEDIGTLREMARILSEGFTRVEDFHTLEQRHRDLEAEVQVRQRAEEEVRVNLAVQRVRNQILQMEDEQDWGNVVKAFQDELGDLVHYRACGINIIDLRQDSMIEYYVDGEDLHQQSSSPVPQVLKQALDTGQSAYRRNRAEMLQQADTDALFQRQALCVVDVPFTTGSIAMNSAAEDAFDERDIHILKQFAPAMSEAYRRLEDLRALQDKETQLRQAQKMEAVGQLTAGIAHNFNNMLQIMRANLDLVMSHEPREFRDHLVRVKNTAQRAAELVQQLMVFSRQDIQGEYQAVDVGALIRETAAICRTTFDRKITIDAQTESATPPTWGEPGQLQQMLMNLCLNARDAVEATERPPSICIEARNVSLTTDNAALADTARPGDYIQISVGDNGIGMDEETQKRMLDPFFTTKPTGRGTGLGLSTVFGVVHQHGGWIHCESALGAGTTFSIYLPTTEATVSIEENTESSGDLEGQETVLVVDDEFLVCMATREGLQKYGYSVLEATDGPAALEIFRREQGNVDLVLLDMSMPQMSGAEVLDQLRQLDPQVNVLISTGHISENMDAAAAAERVIHKPYAIEILAHEIRDILDGPA